MSRWQRLGIATVMLAGFVAVHGPATDGEKPHADPTPNLIVDLSNNFVKASSEQVDSTVEKIEEIIVGADVRGVGFSTTTTTSELVPSCRDGMMDIISKAHMPTKTVSTKGPVKVHNTGLTQIRSVKRIIFTPTGMTSLPAQACSSVDNDLKCIETKYRGVLHLLVANLAERSYYRKYCEAKAESEAKASVKGARKMDEEVAREVAKNNKSLMEDFPTRLRRYKMEWDSLRYHSTCDALTMDFQTVDRSRYALPTVPPPAPVGLPFMTVRAHESLPNTAGFRNFSGQTYDRARMDKELKELSDLLGGTRVDNRKRDPDEEPFEITFLTDDPILYRFDDEKVKITLRTRRFKSGEDEVTRPWATTLTYRIEATEKGIVLVRQGRAQSELLDKKPGQPLGAGEIAGRRILQNRLSRSFPEEYLLEEFTLQGDLRKVGKVKPTQARATNGWLLLGYERVGPADDEKDKPKDKEKAKDKGKEE